MGRYKHRNKYHNQIGPLLPVSVTLKMCEQFLNKRGMVQTIYINHNTTSKQIFPDNKIVMLLSWDFCNSLMEKVKHEHNAFSVFFFF